MNRTKRDEINELEKFNITPFSLKKGKKQNKFSNSEPVSLTSVACKILE